MVTKTADKTRQLPLKARYALDLEWTVHYFFSFTTEGAADLSGRNSGRKLRNHNQLHKMMTLSSQ
ncbi:MAG TPA: hypothetical protein VKR58_13070 [Aquella sp.]|nr:hypothetical protein [Aquella sp.]